jgi:hypothetical protein
MVAWARSRPSSPVIPAPAVEEIRERLPGDGAVERLANSPKKIEDKNAPVGIECESNFNQVQATDSTICTTMEEPQKKA